MTNVLPQLNGSGINGINGLNTRNGNTISKINTKQQQQQTTILPISPKINSGNNSPKDKNKSSLFPNLNSNANKGGSAQQKNADPKLRLASSPNTTTHPTSNTNDTTVQLKSIKNDRNAVAKKEDYLPSTSSMDTSNSNSRKKNSDAALSDTLRLKDNLTKQSLNNQNQKNRSGGSGITSGARLEKLDTSPTKKEKKSSSASISPTTSISGDATLTIDANCNILRWNKNCSYLLGWTADEVTTSKAVSLEIIFPIMQKIKPDLKKYFERVEQKPKDPFNNNMMGVKHQTNDMSEQREEMESILFNRYAKTRAVHKDQFFIDVKMYIRPTKLKEGYRFNITINDAPPTPETTLKRADSFQSLLTLLNDKKHLHDKLTSSKRSLSFEALLDVTSPRRNRSRGSAVTVSTGTATHSIGTASPRSDFGEDIYYSNDNYNEGYDDDKDFIEFEHEYV